MKKEVQLLKEGKILLAELFSLKVYAIYVSLRGSSSSSHLFMGPLNRSAMQKKVF